ncbi:LINE-1 retrotransposable element ORF1 protein [Dissostichus eleginoides]|uniref:LINE-1 retrotransposable element ORF1 protein n=1 Tax=Dissostichus eleginoides TaxID=100907 RepID=A0AAD9C907_DISEL|nr:LINE-1 retrotransposable element ORF1 protein [Dissostichus eleginoides]
MLQEPKQNLPRTTRNPKKGPTEMEAQGGGQATRADDTKSELASINSLLRGIAADVSNVKMGLEVLQSTVERLGGRMSEAEARISNLEDVSNSRGASIDSTAAHVKKLQDKVTYLEDAGRRNNVRITGISENAEKQDLHGFVLSIFAEKLDLEVDMGFELERAHRVGPKKDDGRSRHILVRLLRFSAREAVLRQEESRMAGQQNLLLPGSLSGGTSAA